MNNQEKYQIGDRVLVKPQIFSLSDGFYHAHIKAIKEGSIITSVTVPG